MSKEAVIQGEWHIFTTDRKSLMERDTDQYQALYCEGRSERISPHPHRIRYNFYVIGVLTLKIGYFLLAHLYSEIPIDSGYDIGKEARQRGLDFDDNIDLEIYEIFDSYTTRTVNLALAGLLLVFGLLFIYALASDTVSIGIPGLLLIPTPIPSWIPVLSVGVLLPFLYFSFLIGYANTGARDEEMANSITEKCTDRDHDSILILVGDKHVEPLSDELEEHGWNVDSNRSDTIIGRIHQRLE
ncbi:hypothetical protein SAMN06266787_10845 [Halorubrum ezzemoulense]|uniref:Uncharacterized protein n=1 Tax=Halorubrum ezzemoulense TaxID=337243 RepID=A0A238Y3X6_HALEZ|nr:hypothetical protein [Halorubrum ezzemoulense]SNR65720.1 hypothetical protein SAMN06266787_10845 [Halorubrum ezzemoulense]